MIFARARFDTPCTIEIEHNADWLHAHVALDGGVEIEAGDKVRVHGRAIQVPFGQAFSERRMATVTRANAFDRLWVKLRAQFDLTELYEISFSSEKLA
jgi:hypothetical protein